MSEQKMSYEERRQKAAQLHVDKWNQRGYLDANGEAYLMATLNEMLEEAETTIAAQAEAIREALWEYLPEDAIPSIEIDRYLLEHGYIEPKTEGDGKEK